MTITMTVGFIVIFWYVDMNTKSPEIIFDPLINSRPLPTFAPLTNDTDYDPQGYNDQSGLPAREPEPSPPDAPESTRHVARPPDWDASITPAVPNDDTIWHTGSFELPISGATGYAGASLHVRRLNDLSSDILQTLPAGKGFIILIENDDWWYIKLDDESGGWVEHRFCFVNLPDIIPSIVYNITNSYDSIYTSSGKAIPNVTYEELYTAYIYNARYGRYEFIVPVYYSTAKKIHSAQQSALADGNTLVLYEAFRPYDVQQTIGREFLSLVSSDADVNAGVNTGAWSTSSFVATLSNHQRGGAIDVSLGRIDDSVVLTTGDYFYVRVTEYYEYNMQTPMHELSAASVLFKSYIRLNSFGSLRTSDLIDTVTPETLKLMEYCMLAGLTPLASEWWHYDDHQGIQRAAAAGVSGRYRIEENFSVSPRNPDRDDELVNG